MKIGDKVVMNDKYRVSEKNKGKVWIVRSEGDAERLFGGIQLVYQFL